MPHSFNFLRNNLFTSYTLEVDFPQIYDFEGNKDQAKKALDSIKAIYNKEKFISQNEHQFEDDFISEVLEILGWSFIRQEEKIIQGKLEKPDFLLFTNQDSKNTYLQIPKEQRTANNEHFSVIAESKAYKVEIDNKKIKDNPHFQILRYLSNLKKDYGILTNGRIWRFYDNSKLSATKIFYEIDLEAILAMSNEKYSDTAYHLATQSSCHSRDSACHSGDSTCDSELRSSEESHPTRHSEGCKPEESHLLCHSEDCKPEESKNMESQNIESRCFANAQHDGIVSHSKAKAEESQDKESIITESKNTKSTIAIKNSSFATQIQNDGDISPMPQHDNTKSHTKQDNTIYDKQLQAFNYFYHIFHAKNFTQDSKDSKDTSTISHILEKNAQSKTNIEDDLQSLIYGINGRDSLFEKIGACIYAANAESSLEQVYENALYFIFRLLFIAYFEDKFDDVLEKHSCFKQRISLYALLNEIQNNEIKQAKGSPKPTSYTNQAPKHKSYIGIARLEEIFRIYNEGNPNYDMPLFNGGLFDSTKTPLLATPKIFSDTDLIEILETLFYYTDSLNTYKRDYRTLSVAHLGTIYEGLLSYFFDKADEDIFYLVYVPKIRGKAKGKAKSQDIIEGYFDSYDYEKIAKTHTIHRIQNYKKGQIYLKNTSNSRKSTASFYTPESITKFLCQEALQESIKTTLNDKNILRFKILDNACGSGHFLIESLNAITKIVLESFDAFPSFKTLYEREKDNITQNITEYIPDYQIDESDIIKRLLLKRVIFGVDVNPFSIELSKLSLWIDSFIFGTPLSFLEHHIKCGNALIGTSIADFKQNTLAKSKGLFLQDLDSKFNALQEVFYKLDSIKDSTEIDIKESKRLYQDEILPTLTKLNLYLNYQNAKHFIKDPQERQSLLALQQAGLESLEQDKKAKELIESYAKTYRFFNYEIEFPEIMQTSSPHCDIIRHSKLRSSEESHPACHSEALAEESKNAESIMKESQNIHTNSPLFIGFDIIIGNPPWDKTKFSDSDFFPQFISNYRTLSKSKKEEIKTNLLDKPYIKAQYEREKAFIQSVNDYYKESYPLNSGSGDGNLFRFFVEKNLHLLAKNATLNYVLPSALMLEEGSLSLRKEILEHKRLNFFYSFENRERIFDIDSRYKFALMQVQNTQADSTHKIKTMFYKTNIDSVYDTNNIIETSLEEIATLSPSQIALQEVRDKKDLEILAKCYARFKPLSLEWLDFRRELDMTNDKDLFIESFSDDLLPLYEGKMIHQFNAEFSEPTYFLDSTSFDERLRSKEIHRLKQDLGINTKEYKELLETMLETCHSESFPLRHSEGCKPEESKSIESTIALKDSSFATQIQNDGDISPNAQHDEIVSHSEPLGEKSKITKEQLEDSFIRYDREFFRLGFRAVASDTNERTLIFSLLPKNVGCGNSIWVSIPKRYIRDSQIFSTTLQHDKGECSQYDKMVSHSEALAEESHNKKCFGRCPQHDERKYAQHDAHSTRHSELRSSEESHSIHHSEDFPPVILRAVSPKNPAQCQINTQNISVKRLLFALGIFNSLVVDYIARGMIQINVNKTYLERIPLPQPSDEELESNQDYRYIYKNALILQLYHDKAGDFEDLQKEFGIDKGQIPSTQKAYDTLRAKLDIHIANLYGLSKEEFCAMLESFKVLNDKQPHYIALLKSLWE